ncbi:putative protein N(5)-glutamine methyltransferase [Streptomyces sp. NPDC005438]|uniref:putative protein N(5)-glutamine methyltransferase n=1 Tax=Streptomyces sp. NPDC005438 TaxID=3156880 RepID=UPI0033B54DD9
MSISVSPERHTALVKSLRSAGCVYAEEEADLLLSTAQDPVDLRRMLEQRISGLPLEQALGWASFCGLRILVEPGVFVPRRRTEFLVRQAVDLAPTSAVIVDLCCGTGAVGAAMLRSLGEAQLYAADVDPAAVRCARRNLEVEVYQGDLFTALPDAPRGRVDVLVANVPYVPSEEIAFLPVEAREHEPRVALDGGPDGLDVLRRVVTEAGDWLAPGGSLLVETSEWQEPTAVELFQGAGFRTRAVRAPDDSATVVVGRATD